MLRERSQKSTAPTTRLHFVFCIQGRLCHTSRCFRWVSGLMRGFTVVVWPHHRLSCSAQPSGSETKGKSEPLIKTETAMMTVFTTALYRDNYRIKQASPIFVVLEHEVWCSILSLLPLRQSEISPSEQKGGLLERPQRWQTRSISRSR